MRFFRAGVIAPRADAGLFFAEGFPDTKGIGPGDSVVPPLIPWNSLTMITGGSGRKTD